MQYEHLVQMGAKDPSGQSGGISRDEIWQGLVLRAEHPMRFDENISEACVTQRGDNTLVREVRFGSLLIVENIVFQPRHEVRYRTEATEQHPASERIVRIEEPQEGVFFLRFSHHTQIEANNDAETAELSRLLPYLQSAYREADLDTARKIVELAAAGQLRLQ